MDKIFPYEICMKIQMYAGHPLVDILKESTIFQYIQLRERYLGYNDMSPFTDGCRDAEANRPYDTMKYIYIFFETLLCTRTIL